MFRRNRSPSPKTPTLLISYDTFTDCCLLQLICRMLSSDVFGHFYGDVILVHLVDCFWPRPEYEPFYKSFEFSLTKGTIDLHR